MICDAVAVVERGELRPGVEPQHVAARDQQYVALYVYLTSLRVLLVTGSDVLQLHTGTRLASLNDGNGVEITKEGVADLLVTVSDGTELSIDLHDAATLGDVVAQINAANPAKLAAAIAADGRRLQLTNFSGGTGAFSVANGVASSTADLGIATDAAGRDVHRRTTHCGPARFLAVAAARRARSRTSRITVTDRNGASDVLDLSGAETFADVVEFIDSADEVTPRSTPHTTAS